MTHDGRVPLASTHAGTLQPFQGTQGLSLDATVPLEAWDGAGLERGLTSIGVSAGRDPLDEAPSPTSASSAARRSSTSPMVLPPERGAFPDARALISFPEQGARWGGAWKPWHRASRRTVRAAPLLRNQKWRIPVPEDSALSSGPHSGVTAGSGGTHHDTHKDPHRRVETPSLARKCAYETVKPREHASRSRLSSRQTLSRHLESRRGVVGETLARTFQDTDVIVRRSVM